MTEFWLVKGTDGVQVGWLFDGQKEADDARYDADSEYPENSPHRVVRLVEAPARSEGGTRRLLEEAVLKAAKTYVSLALVMGPPRKDTEPQEPGLPGLIAAVRALEADGG